MPQTYEIQINRLVDSIIDSMVDGGLELRPLLDQLCSELISRANQARKEADDYTSEELAFWGDAHRDAKLTQSRLKACAAAKVAEMERDIRDFIEALDRGYFGPTDVPASAFVAALRKHVGDGDAA